MIAQIHPRSSFLPLANIVCRQRFSCTGISFRMNFKRTKSMILTYDIHKVCPTFSKITLMMKSFNTLNLRNARKLDRCNSTSRL